MASRACSLCDVRSCGTCALHVFMHIHEVAIDRVLCIESVLCLCPCVILESAGATQAARTHDEA